MRCSFQSGVLEEEDTENRLERDSRVPDLSTLAELCKCKKKKIQVAKRHTFVKEILFFSKLNAVQNAAIHNI